MSMWHIHFLHSHRRTGSCLGKHDIKSKQWGNRNNLRVESAWDSLKILCDTKNMTAFRLSHLLKHAAALLDRVPWDNCYLSAGNEKLRLDSLVLSWLQFNAPLAPYLSTQTYWVFIKWKSLISTSPVCWQHTVPSTQPHCLSAVRAPVIIILNPGCR